MSKTYDVDLWTIIMAIRYGMGRQTFANDDASRLAKRVWGDLDHQQRENIRKDAERIMNELDRRAWAWLLEVSE